MKLNQKIAQFLHIVRKINRPGLIMSVPGLGKTSTIELYCKAFDLNLTTLIASQYAADDILGIQANEGGVLKRLTPCWFNQMAEKAKNGKPNILFIDEITTCDDFIQAPLLDLIFNQSLGGHKLPDNTFILSAGNYEDCLNKAFSMSTPLINRFLILNLNYQDIDINEIISNKFNNVNTKNEILDYLGLQGAEKVDKDIDSGVLNDDFIQNLAQDIASLFKNGLKWECKTQNSMKTGLVGFPSVRSVQYATDYILAAINYSVPRMDIVDIIAWTLNGTENFKMNLKKLLDRKRMPTNPINDAEMKDIMELVNLGIQKPYEITESQYDKIVAAHDRIPVDLYKQFLSAIIQI